MSRTWSQAQRAAAGGVTFERYAEPVRAFPQSHHPLRVARVAAGLTQSELAGLANLDSLTISRIERRANLGSRASHRKLARALATTVAELFA